MALFQPDNGKPINPRELCNLVHGDHCYPPAVRSMKLIVSNDYIHRECKLEKDKYDMEGIKHYLRHLTVKDVYDGEFGEFPDLYVGAYANRDVMKTFRKPLDLEHVVQCMNRDPRGFIGQLREVTHATAEKIRAAVDGHFNMLGEDVPTYISEKVRIEKALRESL